MSVHVGIIYEYYHNPRMTLDSHEGCKRWKKIVFLPACNIPAQIVSLLSYPPTLAQPSVKYQEQDELLLPYPWPAQVILERASPAHQLNIQTKAEDGSETSKSVSPPFLCSSFHLLLTS